MVAVWRQAGAFRGEAKVRTWVFGIARRRAIGVIRARRPTPVDTGAADRTAADSGPGPDRAAVARDELERVAVAITELPDELRECLLLAVGGVLSYAEIAEMLEVPVGTVKSRVAGARRRLEVVVAHDKERQ